MSSLIIKQHFYTYYIQAVEKDARKFAQQNCNSYLNGNVFRETVKKQESTHMWGKSKKNNESQKQSVSQEKSAQKMKGAQQSESPFLKQRKEYMESIRISPEYQKKQEAVMRSYNPNKNNNTSSNNNDNKKGGRDRADDRGRNRGGHTR